MKDGIFKKEAKFMMWLYLSLPLIGIIAAVLIPYLKKFYKYFKNKPKKKALIYAYGGL